MKFSIIFITLVFVSCERKGDETNTNLLYAPAGTMPSVRFILLKDYDNFKNEIKSAKDIEKAMEIIFQSGTNVSIEGCFPAEKISFVFYKLGNQYAGNIISQDGSLIVEVNEPISNSLDLDGQLVPIDEVNKD